MKRRRLFVKILIPLVLASITQAVLFAFIVFLSGTPQDINRSAETRFENNLITAVSLIDSRVKEIDPNFAPFAQAAESDMQSVITRNRADIETFMSDPALIAQFEAEVVANLKVLINENKADGGFVILPPSYGFPDTEVPGSYPGLFLYNPPVGSSNDLVALRGDETAVARGGISKSLNHKPEFLYVPGTTALDWMFEPMKAGIGATPEVLGDPGNFIYWSFPFYLTDHSVSDSFTAISVPLVFDDEPIGAFGIVYMTSDIMQYQILSDIDNLSLMLASYSSEGSGNIDISEAGLMTRFSAENPFGIQSRPAITIIPKYTMDSKNITYPTGTAITLNPSTEYPALYYSDILTYAGNPSVLTIRDIPVYPEDSPYNNVRWGLAAVADEVSVFELSRRLVAQLLIILFIALLSMLAVSAFISRTLSKGLLAIFNSVENAAGADVIPIIDDGTYEIYRLSERLHDLSADYNAMTAELTEEHRRYYLTLINSNTSFLDYNAETDTLRLDTLTGETEDPEIENKIISAEVDRFLERVSAGEFCLPDDISDTIKFMTGELTETITIRLIECELVDSIGAAAHYDNGIRYVSGTPYHIYDATTGKLLRTLTCISDVTSEKKKEIASLHDISLDKTTGFLRPEYAHSAIREFLTEKHIDEYSTILIFVENYWYFTEKYGRFYSDALITEAARPIAAVFGENCVISRECTNEFLIVLPADGRDQQTIQAELKDKLFDLVDAVENIVISDEEQRRIRFCIGVYYNDTARFISAARHKAEIAAAAAFKRLPSRHLSNEEAGNPRAFTVQFYSDVENDFDFTESEDIGAILSDIRVTDDYGIDSRDLNTFAFNILEKTDDMKSAVQILLTRIGNSFGFFAAKIFLFDKNTNAFDCAWEWNIFGKYGNRYSVPVDSPGRSSFDRFMQGKDQMIITPDTKGVPKALSDGLEKTFDSENNETYFAAVIPCPAGENFIGCAVFEADPITLENCDFEELKSIVKLLSAFMAKQTSTKESRAKSEFLSKMSHEIRTPMNAILGMTEIALGDEELSENQEGYLKKIEYSAKYLLTLINDILDISRIESGKTNIEMTEADLDEILHGLGSIIGSQCEAKGIEYIVEDKVKNRRFLTDILKLNQILLNLLGNAVKFTPAGGTITLKVNMDKSADKSAIGEIADMTFVVSDTGIGIAKDRQKKIFEPFEQADNSTVRQYGGTGLGLPISGSYISLLGGEMAIDSAPNEGTTFTFTIPVTPLANSAGDSEKTAEREVNFSGKHILIAEDDALNMEIARTLLEKSGFIVTGVPDGESALKTFEDSDENFFDCILMDIRMPVMDGLEATTKIRALSRPDAVSVPIIALSANAFAEDIKTSKNAGMNDHVIKPLDMRVLLQKLKQFIQ
ncbi:MAG: response regulator [Ruminococcus sp.]|jgi:signal transduction histidine kinase/CheY-like chemotaxis protein/GGDEF domain-containing protein|nr:response regulator [Ruminococcus sp.]